MLGARFPDHEGNPRNVPAHKAELECQEAGMQPHKVILWRVSQPAAIGSRVSMSGPVLLFVSGLLKMLI